MKTRSFNALHDVAIFITEARPRRFSAAGYSMVTKWRFLGAVNAIQAEKPWIVGLSTGRPKKLKMASYADAALMLDSRLGKVAFKESFEILRVASESSNRYSIGIRYPDGERHFLDVLVVSPTKKRRRGYVEAQAGIAICRAPVIQLANDRP